MRDEAQDSAPPASLGQDRRGAIMVLGLFIGIVLTSALFMVMSAGFAFLWRENSQDAADATAYEAAIWQARGMNVVVALNIFIALVLAVLIVWRLVICVTIAVSVLAAIACVFDSQFCELSAGAARGIAQELKQDPKIAGRVYRICKMLHDAQKIVAAGTPPISILGSIAEASKYDTDFGIGFGTNIIPSVGFSTGKKPSTTCSTRQKRWSTKTPDWANRLGKPVSLPVEEIEDLDTVCGKGGKFIPILVFYVIGKVGENFGMGFLKDIGNGSAASGWGDILQTITSKGSNFFCGDFMNEMDSYVQDAIGKTCGSNKQCQTDTQANVDKNKVKPPGGKLKIDSTVLWTKVWEGASNGNLFMQSWSFVRSKRRQLDSLDQTLHMVDILKISTATGDPQTGEDVKNTATTIAQAEMFYDCDQPWSSCSDLAPWAMRWRARLRRVRDPVDYIESDVQNKLVGALYDVLGGAASKYNFGPITTALSEQAGRLIPVGGAIPTSLSQTATWSMTHPNDQSAAEWVQIQRFNGAAQLIH